MNSAGSEAACDPRFRPLIAHFWEPMLLQDNVVCAYGLWPDLSLAYLSAGWFRFAAANGGEPAVSSNWPLGASALSGIDGPLRAFFEHRYLQCLSEQRPWEHCYECSSADRYRRFQMMCYPTEDGAGLLAVHSRLIERPWPATARDNSYHVDDYRASDGSYRQCSYCRRMRRTDRPRIWDRVSDWVREPPAQTSQDICEACLGYYLPQLASGRPLPPLLSTASEPQQRPSGSSEKNDQRQSW